ncbi:MAG: LysM domain-containing protein, partial [PVC group bacterium]
MENPIFRTIGIILISLLLPVLYCVQIEAREDSAHLVFQKTAIPGKTVIYAVKKGDSLAAILRRQRGEQKERVPYDLIRRLNPEIRDLNLIYPGQKIVLPARETSKPPVAPSKVRKKSDPPPPIYKIKEKDSISRILLSELAVNPEDILPIYRSLRELNPDIDDLNRLPAGHTLTLPQKFAKQNRAPAVESFPPAVRPVENAPTETAMKTPQTAEHILGIIRPVVNRMKGTLIAKGNYFIPLKGVGQITIDCSLIPAVELEEGTTVFLDFGNRLSGETKDLIGQSWKNYRFLPGEELGDGLTGLKGVIRRS